MDAVRENVRASACIIPKVKGAESGSLARDIRDRAYQGVAESDHVIHRVQRVM